MHAKWEWVGISSVVNPKYNPDGGKAQMIPFRVCFSVTTTNTTAANPWLVPAYRTAKCITKCWTEFCMKSRHSSPVSLFYLFLFISRVSKSSWQGQPGEQLPQRVPKGPSQPGWGTHQGLFQERWPPTAESVAAWAKHTGPRLSCYSAKLILCRYTQTSSSCSSFFGLLYSRHFTGTSVSLGPSRRKKCCFGVLFFKITTLSYPRHTLLHEAGKEGRESPACTGRQWVWGTAPLAEGSGKRQVPGKLPASKTPARPQRKLWALITHPGHAKRVRVIPPEA